VYGADPARAREFVGNGRVAGVVVDGESDEVVAELAAYGVVANVMLNLDEAITRE
jgi:hypothetical protein